MTDNRTTDELRKLLDERGVEYETYRDIKNRCITKWRTYHGAFVFFAVEKEGKLFVETASDTEHSAICTPEQAIAATLGWIEEPDTIRNELTDSGLIDTCAELGSEREKRLEKLVSDLWRGHECGAGCAMYEECHHPLDGRCRMEERVAELVSGKAVER